MCHTLKKGTTSKLLLIRALDAGDVGVGKTGLSDRTPGIYAAYIRSGEGQASAVPLSPGEVGQYSTGSFVEVDSHLLPGVYQLSVPNAALAAGADEVTLAINAPGAVIEPVTISLVAYDPQDSNRLGMSALGPEGRIAALRGAFPRLTAKELEDVR